MLLHSSSSFVSNCCFAAVAAANCGVEDQDTVSDDLMGECHVDLKMFDLKEDHEDEEEKIFEMLHNGKPAGKAILVFTRKTGTLAGTFFKLMTSVDN